MPPDRPVNPDKREVIRRAAISVSAETGFHQATVEMIASRAGVSVGTIYNYFASKDEILSHIFEMEYARRREFFERINSEPNLKPLEKVEAILRFHLDEMKANPDLASLLVREGYSHRLCHSKGGGRLRGLSEMLAVILGAGVQEGSLRRHAPDIVAPCLMGAVEAAMVLFVDDPAVGGEQLDTTVDEVLALLRHGIQ